MLRPLILLLAVLLLPLEWSPATDEGKRPNIVMLYADDMDFGELGANNPNSKISTSHLDRLAA